MSRKKQKLQKTVLNPIHIGVSGAAWYWGGGRNQPYGHKIVKNALWKMPFGTIIDIHKMYQKIQKNLPDVISGASSGAGKNGTGVNGPH